MLSVEEYTEQKKQDNTDERIEAKKWGVSVDELKLQEEMLSKGNKKRNDTQKCEMPLNAPDNKQVNIFKLCSYAGAIITIICIIPYSRKFLLV